MKPYKSLLPSLITAAAVLSCTNVWADDASGIEGGTDSNPVTYDNASGAYPVVTTILSSPVGSLDGYTYSTYAFLAQDATGSIDMFYKTSAYNGYSPTLGDSIQVTGTYSPFDGIPEITTPSLAITQTSPGTSPGATVATIPNLNINLAQYTADNNLAGSYAGYYVQVNDVTINGGAGGTWPTHANLTGTITDQNNNSMVMFFWASSYSTDGAMGGTPIPSGPVDMDGFVDFFTGTSTAGTTGEAEFVPTSVTALVPEPSVMSLCGLGGVVGYVGMKIRSRKKA